MRPMHFLSFGTAMRKLLPNELLLILAMGWIFESFLQGITGFGVPVAVGSAAADRNRSKADVGGYYSASWTVLGKYFWNTGSSMGCAGNERGADYREQRLSGYRIMGRCFYLGLESDHRRNNLLVFMEKERQ